MTTKCQQQAPTIKGGWVQPATTMASIVVVWFLSFFSPSRQRNILLLLVYNMKKKKKKLFSFECKSSFFEMSAIRWWNGRIVTDPSTFKTIFFFFLFFCYFHLWLFCWFHLETCRRASCSASYLLPVSHISAVIRGSMAHTHTHTHQHPAVVQHTDGYLFGIPIDCTYIIFTVRRRYLIYSKNRGGGGIAIDNHSSINCSKGGDIVRALLGHQPKKKRGSFHWLANEYRCLVGGTMNSRWMANAIIQKRKTKRRKKKKWPENCLFPPPRPFPTRLWK